MRRLTMSALVTVSVMLFGVGTASAQPLAEPAKVECDDTPDGECWDCSTNANDEHECHKKGDDCTLVDGPRGDYWVCDE